MEFGISSKNNYSLITIEDGNTIGICGSGRGFKWTGEYDDTKIISKEEWIKHIEKLNISTVTTWIWLIERYFPNETEIRSEFCKVEDNLKNEIGLMIDDMEKSGFLSEKTIRKQLKNYLSSDEANLIIRNFLIEKAFLHKKKSDIIFIKATATEIFTHPSFPKWCSPKVSNFVKMLQENPGIEGAFLQENF